MLMTVLRRILPLPLVLLAASVVVFLLPRLTGADVTRAVLRARTAEATPDAAVVQRVSHELGLEASLPEQYLRWLGKALTGDLGISY
jgi:ABC-type dipeptide/oligopeptide/nickel transport system permease component